MKEAQGMMESVERKEPWSSCGVHHVDSVDHPDVSVWSSIPTLRGRGRGTSAGMITISNRYNQCSNLGMSMTASVIPKGTRRCVGDRKESKCVYA